MDKYIYSYLYEFIINYNNLDTIKYVKYNDIAMCNTLIINPGNKITSTACGQCAQVNNGDIRIVIVSYSYTLFNMHLPIYICYI